MSDYERNKAVRYKPTENFIKQFGIDRMDDLWELENKLPEVFSWNTRRTAREERKPYFAINSGYDDMTHESHYYIDCVLYNSEGAGDWGKVRKLYPTELVKYTKIFKDTLGIEPDCSEGGMKLVDYCYYNGCDAPDYFDETSDPFFAEV